MVVFLPNKSSDKAFCSTSDEDKDERHFSDDDENWTKLQDIASRRRIQNRISQRKRRRRLKENSLSQSSTATSPPGRDTTPKPRQDLIRARSKTESYLDRAHFHPHGRARSTSQISDLSLSSLDGDSTPTQSTSSRALTVAHGEGQMSATPPPPPPALTGNWDQQFFDQAFVSEIQAFDGGPVDFLYNAGAAGMMASPAYPPSSSFSPAMSFSSEGSIDGLDNIHIDPKLTHDYNEYFDTHIPFNGGSDLCLTPPQFDFHPSPLPTKAYPFTGYSTPPSSLQSRQSSLQSTPESMASSTFTDISGNTALHLAAEKGHMGIVQLLLDTGIDINAANKDSQTCLHIAVARDNVAMAGLLMEKGALADAKNGLGQNALHIAVEKGDTALVGLVLDYVTDVDARDCLGQTAFHRAVAMGWEEIVRLMLLRGVNSQAKVGGQPGGNMQQLMV